MHCSSGNEKCSGFHRLMDSTHNCTDKKTLKRWFFIDKRVG
ncbi:LDL receptor-like module domain-containing protein [Dioscorea alata]|uniref:LDL receptor-like module domain-containing protein n=1 Tax=Dioscorea alata TaxID=55571 RepID=A0ACB7WJ25_DIOAL|nr:LDL receptor-like module domain-containing protein [Dioscorea alata]